jgi:hypothetical protein
MKRTMKFYAKTSDCFSGLICEDGKVLKDIDGYPPLFLGDGDGVELEIDLATGQILRWDAAKATEEIDQLLQE